MSTEGSGAAAFPPEQVLPASMRINQLLTCTFLAVRKAATEKYKKQDGSPLMQYHQTLNDRDEVRNAVLEYEITHGMVSDDRPQNGVAQMSGSGNGASAPPPGTVPQMMAQPAPVVASAAQAVQVAVQNPVPQQQEMPQGGMPTTKTRRAAPKLPSSVAPVPVTSFAPAPQPPPGATVLTAPAAPPAPTFTSLAPVGVPTPVQAAPAAPSFAPPQQQAAPAQAATVDVGPLMGKFEELLKAFTSAKGNQDTEKNDFKALVSNLSGQINDTNKQLADIKATQDILMVAIHHMFLCSPAAQATEGKANDIVSFKKYLSKYLPQ